MGPAHPPYERFIAAPGHQMGFNDLKVIEAHEFLNRILGRPALTSRFRRRASSSSGPSMRSPAPPMRGGG